MVFENIHSASLSGFPAFQHTSQNTAGRVALCTDLEG